MGNFLDLRTSVNSNITGFPGTALSTATVAGDIGLQTASIANPIVALSGNLVFSAATGATITALIVRDLATTVYTQIRAISASSASANFIIVAADLLGPAQAQTRYQLIISATPATAVTRVGPESFYGLAQNGGAPATS